MEIMLRRVGKVSDGVFGVLSYPVEDGYQPFAVTLEHSYHPDNKPKIPAGKWKAKRTRYVKGGYDTFEVLIPNHSRILFHKGNTEADSEGCILVGEMFSIFSLNKTVSKHGIARSAEGFNEFMALVSEVDEFGLEVKDEGK
jgi:Family of unknown function (DUF5675)